MKTVSVKYPLGHTIQSTFERDEDIYCPSCGEQGVWIESGGGDVYEGPKHICTTCESSFTLPRLGKVDGTDAQIVEQLKVTT